MPQTKKRGLTTLSPIHNPTTVRNGLRGQSGLSPFFGLWHFFRPPFFGLWHFFRPLFSATPKPPLLSNIPFPSTGQTHAPVLPFRQMPRKPDSGQLDLREFFLCVQYEMLSQLSVSGLFEHASTAGAATERHWIDLFNRYLPQRYRTTPAFVVDSTGRRSRQIDIAIFDNLYSPLMFPHTSGLHIPAESVYAIFEVKPTFSKQWIREASEKAASVRRMSRTSVPIIAGGKTRTAIRPAPILAGLLASTSIWNKETFDQNLRSALKALPIADRLDLGCSLEHGSFEQTKKGVKISTADESLIFFILRLLDRLRQMGTAPAADLMKYGQSLTSIKTPQNK